MLVACCAEKVRGVTATRKKRSEELKLQVSHVLLGEHCLTRQLGTNSCMCCRVALRTQSGILTMLVPDPSGLLSTTIDRYERQYAQTQILRTCLNNATGFSQGCAAVAGFILLSEAFKQLCNLGILLAIPFTHTSRRICPH